MNVFDSFRSELHIRALSYFQILMCCLWLYFPLFLFSVFLSQGSLFHDSLDSVRTVVLHLLLALSFYFLTLPEAPVLFWAEVRSRCPYKLCVARVYLCLQPAQLRF